jgi:preprotein translocase subunit SecB
MLNNEKSENLPEAQLRKIYMRNLSLETATSAALLNKEINPEVKLEIRVQINPLVDAEEVILDFTLTVRETSNLLYLLKLQQAGCFVLKNLEGEQKQLFLNTTCPQLLFPYASQIANTLIVQSGFPALNIMPIDFTQLYHQQNQRSAQAKAQNGQKGPSSEPISSQENKWINLKENV